MIGLGSDKKKRACYPGAPVHKGESAKPPGYFTVKLTLSVDLPQPPPYGGNKVFKLDVQFFHQKQPNCVLDLQEATTKNEEKKLSSQN